LRLVNDKIGGGAQIVLEEAEDVAAVLRVQSREVSGEEAS
jgi:hypothetical protein